MPYSSHIVSLAAAALLSGGLAASGKVADRALPPRVEPRPTPAPPVVWRRSCSLGSASAGSLVRGVAVPREGTSFFTWDPVLRRAPSRAWRRFGSDRAVRAVLRVIASHRRAHPRGPRVGIGDLSRPRGGEFGPQWGFIGHASHQNGLDVDVYYPRLDRREAVPLTVGQVDRRLSQDLVDRFVAAGAEVVFVGPNVGLTGPRGRVVPLSRHDNHLHVRFPPDRRPCR